MNKQHTPGPWTYGKRIAIGQIQTVSANGIAICKTFLDLPAHRQEANARLIAAAPDLLAALERVLEIVQSGEDIRAESHFGTDQNWIKSAIAKAKESA